MFHSSTGFRHCLLVVGIVVLGFLPADRLTVVASQGEPPGDAPHRDDREPPGNRLHWGIAGGPVIEVATPGDRERELGLLAVPSIGIRVASWFEYVVEGHAARYFTPVAGNIVGVVPIGWRIHGRGRTQPYLSAGAGVTWTDFTELRGLDRRRNYITQIGGGVRRRMADGSAVSLEARFSHLSNMSSAPPNLGMENVAVVAGYLWR